MKFWTAIIRQALLAGFLSKDIETYGTLKVTEKEKSFPQEAGENSGCRRQ